MGMNGFFRLLFFGSQQVVFTCQEGGLFAFCAKSTLTFFHFVPCGKVREMGRFIHIIHRVFHRQSVENPRFSTISADFAEFSTSGLWILWISYEFSAFAFFVKKLSVIAAIPVFFKRKTNKIFVRCDKKFSLFFASITVIHALCERAVFRLVFIEYSARQCRVSTLQHQHWRVTKCLQFSWRPSR